MHMRCDNYNVDDNGWHFSMYFSLFLLLMTFASHLISSLLISIATLETLPKSHPIKAVTVFMFLFFSYLFILSSKNKMKNVFYKVCEIIYSNFSVITPRNLDILLNDNKSNMKSL